MLKMFMPSGILRRAAENIAPQVSMYPCAFET